MPGLCVCHCAESRTAEAGRATGAAANAAGRAFVLFVGLLVALLVGLFVDAFAFVDFVGVFDWVFVAGAFVCVLVGVFDCVLLCSSACAPWAGAARSARTAAAAARRFMAGKDARPAPLAIGDLEGLEAVVIALAGDASTAELEEHREVRAHFAARGYGRHGHR